MEKLPSPPRPSRVTVPRHCHPAAAILFSEMRRLGVTYDSLEWTSGVTKAAIKAWRHSNSPGLDTISAALGAVGWQFLAVPPMDGLSPKLRERLVSLAADCGADEDALLAQLVRQFANRPLNLVGHVRGRPSPQKKAAKIAHFVQGSDEPAEGA